MGSSMLMIQEEHFLQDEDGNVYSSRVLSNEIFSRYLTYFNQLIVFARVEKIKKAEASDVKLIDLPGVQFIFIPDFRGPKGLMRHSFKIIKTFKKACKNVDVVYLRAPSLLTLFLYRFIPSKLKIGMEFMMGANYFIESDSIIAKFLNSIIDKEAKKLARTVNGSLYVTQYSLQEEYPPNKKAFDVESSDYFTCGVSDVVLKKEYLYVKKKNNSNKNKWVLISIGFMDSYRKGQHILIEVVSLLKEKGCEVELRLIGEGKKKKELQELAISMGVSANVKFLGKITNETVLFEELKKADIFLLPSKLEGLPRVIIEAMAVGLPVIASDVNGNRELVQKKLLVTDFMPESYASKVELLLNDTNYYNRISIENYNKACRFLPGNLDSKRNSFFESLSKFSI